METRTYNQIQDRVGELFGAIYWHNAHSKIAATPEYQANPRPLWGICENIEAIKAEFLELSKVRRKDCAPELNERGNAIIRWSRHGSERYHWDFGPCSPKFGWKQFDTNQDAWYFGVWVHVKKRLIFTYCEGDCSLVVCPDQLHLKAELDDAERFYGPTPPCMIAADGFTEVGKLKNPVAYYDERPKADVPEQTP